MSRRIIFSSCHLVERKNDNFTTLRRLSSDKEELDGGGAHVRDWPICLGMVWSGYSMVGSSNRLRRLSPGGAEKWQLCGSPATVTRRRGAGWRWGACQGASSSGPRSKRKLFIASGTLSGGGDSSPGGSSSS
ncbi:unnamed protein product [Spirodela intermedia]|uniref:Uncharacterized protein n=1 Tax=Spirodela intermedia TaxID=51605 RepID=A0A7I8L1T9_SPIIN|nr:unnamed protein product [Spirodela intermedia]